MVNFVNFRRAAARMFGAGVLVAGFAHNVLAADSASAQRGALIAQRWCGACHVVNGSGQTANDAIRAFKTIAQRRDRDWIIAKLRNPHGDMPTDMLTAQDIRDVAAYVVSQK